MRPINIIRWKDGTVAAVWVWRFLFTPERIGWTLGYYPDYERCTHEWSYVNMDRARSSMHEALPTDEPSPF